MGLSSIGCGLCKKIVAVCSGAGIDLAIEFLGLFGLFGLLGVFVLLSSLSLAANGISLFAVIRRGYLLLLLRRGS